MTAQEISEKYEIPISILVKMKEDSKTGTCFRRYQQTVFNSDYTYVRIDIRNGEEFDVSIHSMPVSGSVIVRSKIKGAEISQ